MTPTSPAPPESDAPSGADQSSRSPGLSPAASRRIGWALIVLALVALGARGYQVLPDYLAERVHASIDTASIRVQLPKIDLRDPLGTLSSTMGIDLELKIENQSLIPLTLSHLDYRLQVEGREVARGVAALGEGSLDLPAGSETRVVLESRLDLENMGLAGLDVLTSEQLKIDVNGAFEAGIGPIKVRRKYSIEGHPFSVLKPKLF